MINREFVVELYEEEGVQKIHLSTDGSSGTSYELESLDDIGELVTDYVKDYENEENQEYGGVL